jgi:hypothetical protein
MPRKRLLRHRTIRLNMERYTAETKPERDYYEPNHDVTDLDVVYIPTCVTGRAL